LQDYSNLKDVIYINSRGHLIFEVRNIKQLQVLRQHFENSPMETTKQYVFTLWCQALDLILATRF
jgi:hypothetical protein